LTFPRREPLSRSSDSPRSEETLFRSRSTKMRREMLLSHLLMAVTLVVAALMLAPSGALAHAGHSHAQPAAPIVQRAADAVIIKVASITMQDGVTVSRTSGRPASLLPSSSPDTPQSCPGGCCHSGGTGCCAVWLPPSVEIVAPMLGRLQRIVSVIRGSGITPGALPEPPNALV